MLVSVAKDTLSLQPSRDGHETKSPCFLAGDVESACHCRGFGGRGLAGYGDVPRSHESGGRCARRRAYRDRAVGSRAVFKRNGPGVARLREAGGTPRFHLRVAHYARR